MLQIMNETFEVPVVLVRAANFSLSPSGWFRMCVVLLSHGKLRSSLMEVVWRLHVCRKEVKIV